MTTTTTNNQANIEPSRFWLNLEFGNIRVYWVCLGFSYLDWLLKTEHSLNGESLSYLDMMERNVQEENRRARERQVGEQEGQGETGRRTGGPWRDR